MSEADAGQLLVILAAGQAKRYGGLKPLAPVGPRGEAVVDLVASDAIAGGFQTIVLVISPRTGAEIRSHIEREWPEEIDVRFAVQEAPRGTVDAVLSAWSHVEERGRFAVANADDLYGSQALELLGQHLCGQDSDSALVGFRLDHAVIGRSLVTRGVCEIRPDGYLARIEERRGVARQSDGTFATADNRSPAVLSPSTLVSMNLWVFSTALASAFQQAMNGAGEGEVLLPEVVGSVIADETTPHRFAVLATESRCVGVTHPEDLELVQADVIEQIDRGARPDMLWGAGGTMSDSSPR